MKKVMVYLLCAGLVYVGGCHRSEFYHGESQPETVGGGCDLATVEQRLWCVGDGFLEESDLDDSGNCLWCEAVPELADTCVKSYFECANCGTVSHKGSDCASCKTQLEQRVSLARVVCTCAGCGHQQYMPGDCAADEQLDCFGRELEIICEESGAFPHAGACSN